MVAPAPGWVLSLSTLCLAPSGKKKKDIFIPVAPPELPEPFRPVLAEKIPTRVMKWVAGDSYPLSPSQKTQRHRGAQWRDWLCRGGVGVRVQHTGGSGLPQHRRIAQGAHR